MTPEDANLLNAYRGLLDLARSGKELAVVLKIAAYDRLLGYHHDPLDGEENIYWEIDFGDGYPPLILDEHEKLGRTFFDLTHL